MSESATDRRSTAYGPVGLARRRDVPHFVREVGPPYGAPASLDRAVQRLVAGWHAAQRVEVRVMLAEGDMLDLASEERGYLRLGFSSLHDFYIEGVELTPSTAKRRMALSRLAKRHPKLLAGLESGALSACQALALRDVITDESAEWWIALSQRVSIRELRAAVVAASRSIEEDASDGDADEPVGQRVSFAAPLAARLAFDEGIEHARRVLGYDAPRHACVAAMLAEATSAQVEAGDSGSSVPWGDEPTDARERRLQRHLRERLHPRRHLCTDATGSVDSHSSHSSQASQASQASHPSHSFEPSFSQLRAAPSHDGAPRRAQSTRSGRLDVAANVGPSRWGRSVADGIDPDLRRLIEGADRTLALLFGQLEDFDALLAEAPSKYDPQTPASLIDRIEEIRVVAAPIRALSLRLLLHLETLGAATVLGLRTAESLAGEALRLSPRTHRAMLAEARQLRRRPELEQTFLTGRMGTSKLRLLQGIERERLGPFLERAGRITVRQLKRELALREKLGALRRTLSRELLPGRVEDPLPQGGLEERLLCILLQHGWTIESLEERVTRSANLYTGSELRTLLQRADRLRRGDLHLENPHLQDPAADHALMHRLEVLVDLALLCACPDSLLVGHQVHPRGRQTLDPDMELCRISFWAPREIAQDLDLFLDLVHRRIGPMPTWAAVMILVRDATETWMRVDPAQKPRWWRVYERDRYRCRVPGCTRRSNLHAHHAEFRSRGGVDALWNLVSVCYRHHQDGIHAGHIDAAGDANRGLRWILGPRARRGRAFRVYRGDLRIA